MGRDGTTTGARAAATAGLKKEGSSDLRSLSSFGSSDNTNDDPEQNDFFNYALLICLYTIQGIPMGLSASIPFLIQQKIQLLTSTAALAAASTASTASSASAVAASAARMSYSANAIFALCSWPFSLKLLWAPIVDAVFFKRFGRRKSWVVPVQMLAGLLMVGGSDFVEQQLGLGSLGHQHLDAASQLPTMNVKGVTIFFFVLYFLMATQDIAVDGWALTMLSKKNRGRGPIMNSIGQNIGFFLSFVGFLALNDAESSETLWRPLFRLKSRPGEGLVSLGSFIKFMGGFMLIMTTLVAIFKKETPIKGLSDSSHSDSFEGLIKKGKKMDEDEELDAAEIGIRETYSRLWAVVQLPSVRWLFLILLTYRLPTALSDNVKFLKAVEFGLSKSTTALLSPILILPLGILVPIVGAKIWHGHPLRQFMTAYKIRVTLVPILDLLMLIAVKKSATISKSLFWLAIIASTGLQAIVNSLQFNAQMTFFASRVDPAIGGSYMTCLNTAANLGGTWPSSVVMYLVGLLTVPPTCRPEGGGEICVGGRDAYMPLQIGLGVLGVAWIFVLGSRVRTLAELPDEAWRTTRLVDDDDSKDIEANSNKSERKRKASSKREKEK
jgi:PAT family acetyl-CoA transporter-like MFS transporter 1